MAYLSSAGLPTAFSIARGRYGNALEPCTRTECTKKLVTRYGDRLVCVRYRYDPQRNLRHKTVKLIVETTPWSLRARNARRDVNDMVAVRIGYWGAVFELGLQKNVVNDRLN